MYYKCRICGKKFMDGRSLINHLITHEEIPTQTLIKCLREYYELTD
jgi:Zinc finger, C2H2 type.